MVTRYIIAALVCLVYRGVAHATKNDMITFSKCAAKGFSVGDTPCSSCKAPPSVVDASSVSCWSCCTASLDWTSPKKYDTATLRVCYFVLRTALIVWMVSYIPLLFAYPLQLATHAVEQWGGVKEFLEKSASKFNTLTVKNDPSSPPVLTLNDDSDSDENAGGISISVASFKIEHIESLLKAKLRA